MVVRMLAEPVLAHENRVLRETLADVRTREQAMQAVIRDQEHTIRELREIVGDFDPGQDAGALWRRVRDLTHEAETLVQELATRTEERDHWRGQAVQSADALAALNLERARDQEARRMPGGRWGDERYS